MSQSKLPTNRLAFKLAKQELRHGWKHFIVFITCLVLGVTLMAGVNTMGAVVRLVLNEEAQSMQGGHVTVGLAKKTIDTDQRATLDNFGEVSHIASMRTMLQQEDDLHMVEVKAVDDAYPLLGVFSLKEDMTLAQAISDNGVAVDPVVLSQYGLAIGDTVMIGSQPYVIKATIAKEPDRVVQMMSFGPRVMMSHDSLERSGLMSNISLMHHSYRIKLPDPEKLDEPYMQHMLDTLEAEHGEQGWTVRNGSAGNFMVQRFMEQLLGFLVLSGLATFIIAGIGIGSSVRSYLEKKSPIIAVLKVQGASRKLIFRTYMMILAILALTGGVIGALIAAVISYNLLPLIAAVLPAMEGKSAIHLPSLLLAIWYGILIVYLFSIPALLGAINIRPSILFRSHSGVLTISKDNQAQMIVAILTGLLVATLFMNNTDHRLISGAIILSVIAFGLFDWCIKFIRFLAKRIKVKRPWLRLALGNLHRPGSTAGTVIFAIGVSLTVLIALTLTEANFRKRITDIAERDAPALFMIDIQSYQKEPLEAILDRYVPRENVMILSNARGRITKINGEDVANVHVGPGAAWAVRGDRGLSYSAQELPNATIVEGEWWPDDYEGEPLVSVDHRFLEGMNVEIGDSLTYSILGEEVTATIASARKIDYSTFQINFANMFSPGVIDHFPHTYVSTVFIDRDQVDEIALVKEISTAFPGVTVIRTKEVVDLAKELMANIALALSVTVSISLFAGLLVLISALSSSIEQRLYDTAILKVMGARKKEILLCCLAEWSMLACVTSFIAATMGTLGAYLVTERFRLQQFNFMPEVTLTTIALCVIVIWVTGFVGNRRIFNFRVSGLLRNE